MHAPDDRAQIAEALSHLSNAAQRKMPCVGNNILPTPWDLLHRQIDDHLTLWQLAEGPQTLPAQAEHNA
jgi:hypothetical protein